MVRIRIVKPTPQPRLGIYLAGALVWFEREWCAAEGRYVHFAALDDTTETGTAILAATRHNPAFFVEKASADVMKTTVVVSTPHPVAPTDDGGRSAVVLQALSNGWREEDLKGAGTNGDPGPGGGFSATTTLTAAQLSLVVPPPGWAELASTRWPWEIAGWSPAALQGWRHPDVAPKIKDEVPPEPGEPLPAAPPPSSSETAAEPEPEPEPEPGPPEPLFDGRPLSHWLAEYGTPEECDAAVVILQELRDAKSGTNPSFGQARYHLKKHKLPSIGKYEYAALATRLR